MSTQNQLGIHSKRRMIPFAVWMLATSAFVSAQVHTKQSSSVADRLGMACAKILAMPSSDFIAQVVAIDDSNKDGQLRGIAAYGKCYDGRTDRLAASLSKQGKGPLMGARGDFGDFESTLKNFTAKALEEVQESSKVPLAPAKTEYAALYEKQFRYAFYQSYSQKLVKHSSSETTENSGGSAKASPTDVQSSAKPEPDPMTLAKNRFG